MKYFTPFFLDIISHTASRGLVDITMGITSPRFDQVLLPGWTAGSFGVSFVLVTYEPPHQTLDYPQFL